MANQDFNRDNLEKIIESIVDQEGIQPSYKGFRYINEAIYIILQDEERLYALTKEVYGEIAINHNTSIPSVERTIRFAIKNITPKPNYSTYSYKSKDIQTNKTFIANMAQKVRSYQDKKQNRKI